MNRLLVVRLDSVGDVLLAGPAIAVAASRTTVDVLCSSVGQPAAELLPGVDRTIVFNAPWILNPAPPLAPESLQALIDDIASRQYDAAAILTSSHQSALPTAMVLRLAGVRRLAAISNDYPGALLDHRIPGDPDGHEVERALGVMATLDLPVGDPSLHRLRVDVGPASPRDRRVVLHPGAAAPARTLHPSRWREAVRELTRREFEVIVTGTTKEAALCHFVAEPSGACPVVLPPANLRALAELLGTATVVVAGNTGPTHLGAAMGRPVAAVFPPTVPPDRWRPWGVPHVLLGDLEIACAGCRSIRCPFTEQHCVVGVSPALVADAVETLAGPRAGSWAGSALPLATDPAQIEAPAGTVTA